MLITGLIVILIIRFAPFGIWGVVKLVAGKFVEQEGADRGRAKRRRSS